MKVIESHKKEETLDLHNSNFTKENKGIDFEYQLFLTEIAPAMLKKERDEVFYGNPSTERLEEIMEKVIVRAQIRKEILLEKLS
jgi:hypothetical protein